MARFFKCGPLRFRPAGQRVYESIDDAGRFEIRSDTSYRTRTSGKFHREWRLVDTSTGRQIVRGNTMRFVCSEAAHILRGAR
jgi:hypothetical protein